ncbi:ADP-ribosylglycohydrolase family protein [Paenibacillus sp. FSL R7-0048]|uniref:ADP-ribosylglycohydrolase family protein n=1 Tax=Paenibacillus TaxID=44249 RepID=UPI00096FCA93|nr:ADP-ribosylglycohydrolase family protein [Paenibacillus odorifer]OMD73677.1 hypothetical protein BSK48_02910 [Paenibacillus odorifer]
MWDKIKGGLYGLLIGDALGVPYEFRSVEQLPPLEQIEFTPPVGFQPTYRDVPAGTWSDDGAQALCLLESLIDKGTLELTDFADKLVDWYHEGRWAVAQQVFDVGIQTSRTLSTYYQGMSPYESGNTVPDGKGNGALMRVLPLALWHKGTDKQLVQDAHTQCLVTHAHICNQVCCAFYVLIARELLQEQDFNLCYRTALSKLRTIYQQMPEHERELEENIHPDKVFYGEGSGYVVDSLFSACMILQTCTSYEDAVKRAVALGNDTDTTACITGGLAGIRYGYEHIPQRWINQLRETDLVDQLLLRLQSA